MTNRGVPFLILEMVKTEYRRLKLLRRHPDPAARRLAEDLQIYTVGDERVSPIRFNPLRRLPGIPIDEHIDNLWLCFQAAMPMAGPLPALLREALELVFAEHPDPDDPPGMADLVAAAERVLALKGYSPETNSDLRAALEVRLGLLTHGSIGRVFQCPVSIPDIEPLLKSPAVIELDRLAAEQACLLALFILTKVRECLKTRPPRKGRIQLVIIIEEAHLLVGRSTNASPSEDNADPKAYAAEYLVRMLAELRALGVCIVVVDQLPSAVAPQVIKNTASKLAFRQVALDDREELGASMLFGPAEVEEVARLEPGEAYLYTEGYHGPRRIQTVNPFKGMDLSPTPLNEAILPHIQDDEWFIQATRDRRAAELIHLRRQMDSFDAKRMGHIRRAAELVASYPRTLARSETQKRLAGLNRLVRAAVALRRELASGLDGFSRHKYQPLIGVQATRDSGGTNAFRSTLERRFESVIATDLRSCMKTMDELVARCRTKISKLEGD